MSSKEEKDIKDISLPTDDSEKEGTQDDEGGEDDRVCLYCGDKPCFWQTFKQEIVSKTMNHKKRTPLTHNQWRKLAYRKYVNIKYGKLGKGTRIRIPVCAEHGIRSIWPDTNGKGYMGFKDDYDQVV